MFISSKLGQNSSDIHVGTFARTKNLIWDQLLATKAEISYPELSYIFVSVQNRRRFCNLKGIFNALKRHYVWPWNTLTVINVRSCLLCQKQ